MKSRRITLLVPEFSAVPPGGSAPIGTDSGGVLPYLNWGESHARESWCVSLANSLGLHDVSNLHIPVARLFHQASTSASVYCADPVHFQLGRFGAVVRPPEALQLKEHELAELRESLAEYMAIDGHTLTPMTKTCVPPPSPGTPVCSHSPLWCLESLSPDMPSLCPPSFASKDNALDHIAASDVDSRWARQMTEWQMLLHSHPVNTAREAAGLPTVNGVWIWGGAPLPVQTLSMSVEKKSDTHQQVTVFAEEPFAIELCRWLNIACKPLSAFQPATERCAVVLDTRIALALFAGDTQAALRARERVEQQWLAPLSARLKRSEHITVRLVNETVHCAEMRRGSAFAGKRWHASFYAPVGILVQWVQRLVMRNRLP